MKCQLLSSIVGTTDSRDATVASLMSSPTYSERCASEGANKDSVTNLSPSLPLRSVLGPRVQIPTHREQPPCPKSRLYFVDQFQLESLPSPVHAESSYSDTSSSMDLDSATGQLPNPQQIRPTSSLTWHAQDRITLPVLDEARTPVCATRIPGPSLTTLASLPSSRTCDVPSSD